MSRRAAEAEIAAGKVKVNGIVAEVGMKIDPDLDTVEYGGKTIKMPRAAAGGTYVLVNKPVGYVCTLSDEKGRLTLLDLVKGIRKRVYPVGRLDLISEGMILLTDDGELKNRLTHPSHSVPKVYRVKVGGEVSDEQYEILTSALIIDDYKIKPVDVVVSESDESGTVLKMTLHEGRNRQIRKMCEQVGLKVAKLTRVAIGDIALGNLEYGKWRYLTKEEVAMLKK